MINSLEKEIIARIEFFSKEQGGIEAPKSKFIRDSVTFDEGGSFYPAHIFLDHLVSVKAGDIIEVPMVFLDYELVSKFIRVGAQFLVWERRFIAKGKIIQVLIKPE